MTDRNGWIYEQRQQGRTFRSIAGAVGVSESRVRQIYLKQASHRRAYLRRRGEEIKGDMEDVLGVARKGVAR
jgi:DNA-directed RNA polymerase sigma subunit (sigma70/sigma32)